MSAREEIEAMAYLPTSLVGKRSSVDHRPDGLWKFDQAVTDCFEDMLERSIPRLDEMRELVCEMALEFMSPGGRVMDLGCSKGATLEPLIQYLGARAKYTGVEVSEPMVSAAREALASWIELGYAEVIDHDLRDGLPRRQCDVITSVLTLMFVPINYRQRLLLDAFDLLKPGGALIIVEKVLGEGALIDGLLVDNYHARKQRRGYGAAEIEAKRRSLENSLVPVTASWNVDLIKRAGFVEVDCFWRHLNFAAWIAVKGAL